MFIHIIGARSHAFRIFAVFLAVFLTVGFASSANAAGKGEAKGPQDGDPVDKVTICHYDKDNRVYITITPAEQGVLQGHEHHAEDIIPAPAGGCPAGPVLVETTDPGGEVTGGEVTGGGDSSDDENTGGRPGENDGGEPVVDNPGQDNSGPHSSTPVVKGVESGSPDQAGNSVLAEIKDSSAHVGVNRPGAMVLPAAGVLPATGAADNLGLLTAAGLGLVLIGGLTISTRRRPVLKQR